LLVSLATILGVLFILGFLVDRVFLYVGLFLGMTFMHLFGHGHHHEQNQEQEIRTDKNKG